MKEIISYIILALVVISIPAPTTQSSILADEDDFFDWGSVNASCPLYDSCGQLRQEDKDNLVARNCECGPHCNEYETCCLDSRNRNPAIGSRRQNCVKIYGEQHGFFAIDDCSPRWTGNPSVREMCYASPDDVRDPYVLAPAWDIRKNVTYRNFACGICNNVHPDDMNLWTISLNKVATNSRNYTSDELLDSMTFNEEQESWGLWETLHGANVFSRITLAVKPPSEADKTPKRCIPDLVEECQSIWRDQETIDNCRAYMAPIGRKSGDYYIYYRNVHCAACNFVKVSSTVLKCWEPIPIEGASHDVENEFGDTFSLTLLFDVNLKDGNFVNKVQRDKCKEREAYDRFFKKCRSLVCGMPGYVIIDGRCVRS